MNTWTVLAFFVGVAVGGLFGVLTMALIVAGREADREIDRSFLDAIGGLD